VSEKVNRSRSLCRFGNAVSNVFARSLVAMENEPMPHQPKAPLEIRTAGAGDYDDIVGVWVEAGLPYRPQGRDSRESVERELRRGTGTFFLAVSNGRPVGVVLGTHDGRKGWINRLAVTPTYRRKGIARRLVQCVETWLEAEGIAICAALIERPNGDSMAFFAELGYAHDLEVVCVSKRKNPGA
jgi:GNAT superfamily N-acetyltransferase